jgi:nitrogenase molybdenum-iron protein alpha/beta subunit
MENNLREFYKDSYLHGDLPHPHDFTPSGKATGAIYAISSVQDAIAILHGSSGCGFHYRFVCRRSDSPAYELQCTGLEEKDIVMGGAEKLRRTIIETVEKYHPSLIAIIPTTPVDMIHDDIAGVLAELSTQLDCKLISVKSEKISHADKRIKGKVVFCKTQGESKQAYNYDGDIKGCGFSEAMKAIVMNVMKPQKIKKNTINICAPFRHTTGSALLSGIIKEFKNIGISVNTYIPNCKVKDLETAPRAALNLVTGRMNWAMKMKEIFGTDYFLADFDECGYSGLDGIEQFYLNISRKLELPQSAETYLAAKKREVSEFLLTSKVYMEQYSCALCCSDYRNLSKLIRFYKNVLKFKIPYVLIRVSQKRYTSIYSMDELNKFAAKFISEAAAEADEDTKWFINPAQDQVNYIFDKVDNVVGQGCFSCANDNLKFIEIPQFIPMDFDNFQSFVVDYNKRIKNASECMNQSRGIYDCEKVPDDENRINIEGTLSLWDKLWIQRG